MPRAFIPAPLRDLTGGVTDLEVDGATVRDVVDALDARFPGVRARLCRGDDLAPGLQVAVDHVLTRRGLRAAVGPTSEVHFVPAINGG